MRRPFSLVMLLVVVAGCSAPSSPTHTPAARALSLEAACSRGGWQWGVLLVVQNVSDDFPVSDLRVVDTTTGTQNGAGGLDAVSNGTLGLATTGGPVLQAGDVLTVRGASARDMGNGDNLSIMAVSSGTQLAKLELPRCDRMTSLTLRQLNAHNLGSTGGQARYVIDDVSQGFTCDELEASSGQRVWRPTASAPNDELWMTFDDAPCAGASLALGETLTLGWGARAQGPDPGDKIQFIDMIAGANVTSVVAHY